MYHDVGDSPPKVVGEDAEEVKIFHRQGAGDNIRIVLHPNVFKIRGF